MTTTTVRNVLNDKFLIVGPNAHDTAVCFATEHLFGENGEVGLNLSYENARTIADAIYEIIGECKQHDDALTKELVRQKVFDFPQGCEDQKWVFLATLGIEKPKTITIQARFDPKTDRRLWIGFHQHTWSAFGLRDIKAINAAANDWYICTAEVFNVAVFETFVDEFGMFSDQRGDVQIRGFYDQKGAA